MPAPEAASVLLTVAKVLGAKPLRHDSIFCRKNAFLVRPKTYATFNSQIVRPLAMSAPRRDSQHAQRGAIPNRLSPVHV
jgi:hypothetical protein